MSAVPTLGVLDLGGDIAPVRVIDPDTARIVAQVTIEEDHEDELTITEHPVEQGAAITDHAYKRPATVRLQLGWSQSGGVWNTPNAPQQVADVKQLYEQVLTLQAARRPFQVFTGKRAYKDMLVASLRTRTDHTLETSFIADISLQQIILVNVQTTTVAATTAGPGAAANPDPAQLANAPANQPATQAGTLQPKALASPPPVIAQWSGAAPPPIL